MKIIMENWRGYVAEAQENEKVSDIMDQAFDHLVNSLKKVEPGDPEKEVDEGALVAASAILAAPQVLEIVGETINWIVPTIKRYMGKTDVSDSTAFGNKLLEWSKSLHHKYLIPIRYVVKRLFPDKDDEWNKKVANRLFHLIVAAFLVSAGLEAASALAAASAGAGTSAIVMGTIESALTAIKSNEIWEFLAGT